MTEAEFLAQLRALPLHPGALGLRDDAARLGDFVLTTDTLVEGVHYLAGDPPGDVAWKLVATNLSDLAAKGATPVGVLLNYPLRRTGTPLPSPAEAGARLPEADGGREHAVTATADTGPLPSELPESKTCGGAPLPGKAEGESTEHWDTAFLTGLAQALTCLAAPLLGGDTVTLPAHAPRVISLTAIGENPDAPFRSGARTGDALYVTGTIGDAGAGLAIAKGAPGPDQLLAAYRRPQPRLAEGQLLARHVHAMMDVSDGLLLDAARMAEASGLAVAIDLAAVPLSPAYRAQVGEDRAARLAAATAGDDYQLLFAAPADLALPCPATRIGQFAPGSGLTLDDAGVPVALPRSLGFAHGEIRAGLPSQDGHPG